MSVSPLAEAPDEQAKLIVITGAFDEKSVPAMIPNYLDTLVYRQCLGGDDLYTIYVRIRSVGAKLFDSYSTDFSDTDPAYVHRYERLTIATRNMANGEMWKFEISDLRGVTDPLHYTRKIRSSEVSRCSYRLVLRADLHVRCLARFFDPLPDPRKVVSIEPDMPDATEDKEAAFRYVHLRFNVEYLPREAAQSFESSLKSCFTSCSHTYARNMFADAGLWKKKPEFRLVTRIAICITVPQQLTATELPTVDADSHHSDGALYAIRCKNHYRDGPELIDDELWDGTRGVFRGAFRSTAFGKAATAQLLKKEHERGFMLAIRAVGALASDVKRAVASQFGAWCVFAQPSAKVFFAPIGRTLMISDKDIYHSEPNLCLMYAFWYCTQRYLVDLMLALAPLNLHTHVLTSVAMWLPTVCMHDRDRVNTLIIGLTDSMHTVVRNRERRREFRSSGRLRRK